MKKFRNAIAAKEIKDFLKEEQLANDTMIYYNGIKAEYQHSKGWIESPGLASDYFNFTNNDETVAMSFEGMLYDVIKDQIIFYDELIEIFTSNGFSLEQGESWNLFLYDNEDNLESSKIVLQKIEEIAQKLLPEETFNEVKFEFIDGIPSKGIRISFSNENNLKLANEFFDFIEYLETTYSMEFDEASEYTMILV